MERRAGLVVQCRGTIGAVRKAVTLRVGTWRPVGISGRQTVL